jgi:hypothetical protein
VDVDLGDGKFSCRDGSCPAGFTCVAERCVSDEDALTGGDVDAAEGADAAAEPDAAAADAAAAPDGGEALTCDELFSAAPGYELCTEEPASCAFFVSTDASSTCSAICADLGAECLNGHDAEPTAPCTPETEDGCEALHFGQICTCAR